MKLFEKLNILDNLKIIDWFSESKNDESVRVIVNSLATYFLEDKTVIDYTPVTHFEEVYDHFVNTGYDLDWYDMVTLKFLESIELNIGYAVHCITYSQFDLSKDETEKYVLNWVEEWCSNCRKAFIKSISE